MLVLMVRPAYLPRSKSFAEHQGNLSLLGQDRRSLHGRRVSTYKTIPVTGEASSAKDLAQHGGAVSMRQALVLESTSL